tara:strand:+ start:2142 stop:2609 length:468 start_codon:yes stop_codon:yes gene_type:complete
MATLKVTLQEECNIEGVNYGSTRTKTFSSITSVYKHIVSVSTSGGEILAFADAAGNVGTLDRDSIEYLRITNLDGTNFVELGIEDTSGNNAYFVKLDAGKSFILPTPNTTTEHPTFFAVDNAHATSTHVNINSITADADTAACNVEIFVAMNSTT